MPAQCLGSLFGRSHVANCLKTSRWKVNFSPRGTLAFCSKRSSKAGCSELKLSWRLNDRSFLFLQIFMYASPWLKLSTSKWVFSSEIPCQVWLIQTGFSAFHKGVKKKRVPLLFNFIVVLVCSQWKMPGTQHKNTQSTVSHNHATVLSPLSLSCFLWFFFFNIQHVIYRTWKKDVSTMNVTASFGSIAYEKCLKEWEQRFLAGHLEHSIPWQRCGHLDIWSFFLLRVRLLFVFP